jgi:thiosulfate reductase cytochrome b subunit
VAARSFIAIVARGYFEMSGPPVKSHDRHVQKLHPWPIRIMHWINALAMFVMIGSGWKIYQDEVLFGWLHFPDAVTIGGGPEGALQWHFLGMWILTLNGLAYLVSPFNRFTRECVMHSDCLA